MMKKENNEGHLIATQVETDILKTVLKTQGLLSKDKQEDTLTLIDIENQTLEYELLSIEDKQLVDTIIKELDMGFIINYGANIQLKMADLSQQILVIMQSNTMNQIGQELSLLISTINDFKITPSLFNHLFNKKVNQLIKMYPIVEANIGRMSNNLEKQRIALLKDMTAFEMLAKENRRVYKQLSLYIIAGDKKIEYEPLFLNIDDLNRRLEDLKLTRIISLQLDTQIGMLLKCYHQLVKRIESSYKDIIPLWKKQVALILGISHSLVTSKKEVNEEELKQVNHLVMTAIEKVIAISEESRVETKKLYETINKG